MTDPDQPALQPGPDAEADVAAEYATDQSWFLEEAPDLYADTINIGMGPYGLTLILGIRGLDGRPQPNARVHMSHQMALVLHRLVNRVLTTYELRAELPTLIPEELLANLHLRDSDIEGLDAERKALVDSLFRKTRRKSTSRRKKKKGASDGRSRS